MAGKMRRYANLTSSIDGMIGGLVGAVARIDIVSDTHGSLSSELLRELRGADLIIHAGDITSEEDFEQLKMIAPIRAVLGNNDYFYNYGPDVKTTLSFTYEGLRFFVAHYREELPRNGIDVGVCGHTHVPKMEHVGSALIVNPGSASLPRTQRGPSIARMFVSDGAILSCDHVFLD